MNILLKKKSYFNKKVFYISLIVSTFLNFLILIFFSTISKIVNPPKIPEEPKIKFVEIKEEKEKPIIKKEKKFAKIEPKKKVIHKENLGEKEDKRLPIRKVRPVQTEKGDRVKRELVINKPKTVLPPREKKLVAPKNETKKANKPATIETKKQPQKTVSKPPNIIKTEKKVEKKLPPPPKNPVLDEEYSLAPPKTPDVIGSGEGISELENLQGIKEENPSKLLEGLKTVSPTTTGSKNIEFGKEFKEYDKDVEGTAKTRKLIYMPPPPKIKTKIPLLPRSIKVKIWITPDGRVSNVVLLKKTGDPSLDKAIIEYVKAWRFNKVNINETQWAITTIRFKVK